MKKRVWENEAAHFEEFNQDLFIFIFYQAYPTFNVMNMGKL